LHARCKKGLHARFGTQVKKSLLCTLNVFLYFDHHIYFAFVGSQKKNHWHLSLCVTKNGLRLCTALDFVHSFPHALWSRMQLVHKISSAQRTNVYRTVLSHTSTFNDACRPYQEFGWRHDECRRDLRHDVPAQKMMGPPSPLPPKSCSHGSSRNLFLNLNITLL